MPKHEAQQKLADYIEEFTGKLIHQGDAIESFADLWKAFSAVKAGSWGKKMREDLKCLFNRARQGFCVNGRSFPCAAGKSGRWESGNPDFGFPLFHGPHFFFAFCVSV